MTEKSKHTEIDLPFDVLADMIRRTLARVEDFNMLAYGYSMSPFINPGDRVTISRLKKRPVFGQVIAVIQPVSEAVLLHRVIAVKKDGCLTQGDNRVGQNDGVIPFENVLGCISKVERRNMKVFFGQGITGIGIAALSQHGLLQKLVRFMYRMMKLMNQFINK